MKDASIDVLDAPFASADDDEPKKSFFHHARTVALGAPDRIREFWLAVSGIALSLVGLLAFAAVALSLYGEINGNSIAIADINATKDIVDEGYTPAVSSARLRDAVETYVKQANSSRQLSSLSLAQEQQAVVLPTLGLPLDVVGDTLAHLLHLRGRRRIAGEFTETPQTLTLRLRLNDRMIFDGSQRAKPGGGASFDVDALLARSVPAILDQYAPFIVADHLDFEHQRQAAIDKAQTIIDTYPASDENVAAAYSLLGGIYAGEKQYPKAKAAVERIIAIDPRDAVGWQELGAVDLLMGNDRLAIDEERKAIWYDPSADWPHDVLGRIYAGEHKADLAASEFDDAIRLAPADADVRTDAAIESDRLGERARAVAEFEVAARLDPRNSNTLASLGNDFLALGEPDHAAAAYRSAARLKPTAQLYHSIGDIEAKEGRDASAIADYERSLALAPRDENVHIQIGVAYFSERRYQPAVAEFERAIALDPRSAIAYDNLGHAEDALDHHKAAVFDYIKAVRLDPKFSNAWNDLGIVLFDAGKYKVALLAFRTAAQLDPHDPDPPNNVGAIDDGMHRVPDAIAEYRKAVALAPKVAKYHVHLAADLRAMGRRKDAIAEYRTALGLEPGNVDARGALRALGQP